MRLLQGSWSEVLTLSLVFRSIPATATTTSVSKLSFAQDLALNESQASSVGLGEFFQHVSCFVLEIVNRKLYFILLSINTVSASD